MMTVVRTATLCSDDPVVKTANAVHPIEPKMRIDAKRVSS